MVKSVIALILLLCVTCPTFTGAEESTPNYDRIRAALQRPVPPTLFTLSRASLSMMRPTPPPRAQSARRDSVWNGALIGAGIGGVGGYFWARNICGSNDPECFAITAPVGVLGGGGIGAAIGAILDALDR